MANPENYINLTASCIRIFMAGFMSDYKVDPNIVANSNGKYKLVKNENHHILLIWNKFQLPNPNFRLENILCRLFDRQSRLRHYGYKLGFDIWRKLRMFK